MKDLVRQRWAVLWRSKNKMDGERSHLVSGQNSYPILFTSRQAARDFINGTFGYIRDREDLRNEPHGWKKPKAVKVCVRISVIGE